MKRVILASGVCIGLIVMAMGHSSREQYVVAGNYSADTTKKPKPDSVTMTSAMAYLTDTTKKPKPDSTKAFNVVAFQSDTTKKPKPDSTQQYAYVAYQGR